MNDKSEHSAIAGISSDRAHLRLPDVKQSYALHKESVCAVVVTYNRKLLLIKCLESLRKQTVPLDAIYVIDNASADATPEHLKDKGYITDILCSSGTPQESEHSLNMLSEGNTDCLVRIHYVRMHKNTGGSGGFYEGVKRGYERGYDWLWLMDDDCSPDMNCLYFLCSHIEKYSVFGPLAIDQDGNPIWNEKTEKPTIAISDMSFNGFLISRLLIQKIGYPVREFFIYADDVEYSYRVTRHGGKVWLINKAILKHPRPSSANKITKKISLFKKIILEFSESDPENSTDRFYYTCRNNFVVFLIYFKFIIIFRLVRKLISICVYGERKIIFTKIFAKAFIDAFRLKKVLLKNKDYIFS